MSDEPARFRVRSLDTEDARYLHEDDLLKLLLQAAMMYEGISGRDALLRVVKGIEGVKQP